MTNSCVDPIEHGVTRQAGKDSGGPQKPRGPTSPSTRFQTRCSAREYMGATSRSTTTVVESCSAGVACSETRTARDIPRSANVCSRHGSKVAMYVPIPLWRMCRASKRRSMRSPVPAARLCQRPSSSGRNSGLAHVRFSVSSSTCTGCQPNTSPIREISAPRYGRSTARMRRCPGGPRIAGPAPIASGRGCRRPNTVVRCRD